MASSTLIGKLIQVWKSEDILGFYQTLAWGQPLIVLSLFAGVGLQIGLMGRDYPDGARERLARIRAWLAACAAGWAALFGGRALYALVAHATVGMEGSCGGIGGGRLARKHRDGGTGR